MISHCESLVSCIVGTGALCEALLSWGVEARIVVLKPKQIRLLAMCLVLTQWALSSSAVGGEIWVMSKRLFR